MKDENLNSQEKQFLSKSARALSKKLKAPYETIYQVLVENYEKIDTSLYSSRVIGVGKRHYESFPADEHFESTWVEELDKELSFEYESPLSAVSYIKDSKEPDVLVVKQNALNVLYGDSDESSKHEDSYIFHADSHFNSAFTLKEHQKAGIAWLQNLITIGVCGCLQSDDMGLGKTLQILYLIIWCSSYISKGPFLIVAPMSLLSNWESEYQKFFNEPRLNVDILKTSDIQYGYNRKTIEKIQNMDIIICSYETLRKGQVNLGAVDFEIVVLDEAQRIKSPSTQIASAAKALNAKFKIAATGTPIENSRMDLWSIMDFCAPGILGSAEDFIRMQNVCDIQKRMGKHFLRRVKQDVIEDLPEIMTVKNKNLMEETQADMYLDVVREYKPGVNDLQTIHDLKTISEHPLLYCGILDEANVNDIISCSARMENTMDILSNIRRVNEKVIIFVERKDMQKAMAKVFWQKFKLDVGIVNGDIPTFDKHGHNVRQQLIDDFSAVRGFNIIIMSPLSSGVGLNVVAANHVIHYSRHWNPAKEQQATDRVYRIGQTKDVHVYYPMAVHPVLDYSFDETLDELLQQKKHLADSTIYPIDKLEITAEDFAKQMFT